MPTQMNLPVLVAAAVEAELNRNPERFRSVTPGPQGDSLTLEAVTMEADFSLTLRFSDGTVYNSLPLRGARGETGEEGGRGPRGVGVHHTRWTATTNPEHHFGVAGHMDTYTLYGDEEEDIVLGWFSVKNGENGVDPFDLAVSGGYDGTRDEFYEAFIRNSVAIDELQELIGQVEHLFEMVNAKGAEFTGSIEQTINDFLAQKGAPGGFAGLDEDGKVPIEQIPDAAKGVIRVNKHVELPVTGVERQLYFVVEDETAEDKSTIYHWNGFTYLPVTSKLDIDEHAALLAQIDSKADASLADAVATLTAESATKEELDGLEQEFSENLDALTEQVATNAETVGNSIEEILERLERKSVEEVDCYCNLPEEGEGDKIYVVTKDESRAGTLSFYYWDGEQYRLVCGTAVKELEQLGDTSEAAISHIWNTGTATILSGTPVMVSGSLVDNLLGVVPLLLSDPEAEAKYVGIALTDIPGNAQGVAVRSGVINGFNTTASQGEDWVVGDALYFRGNGSAILSKEPHADPRFRLPVAYVLHVSPTEGIVYLGGNPFGQFSRTGTGLVGDGTDENPLDIGVTENEDNLLHKTEEGLEVLIELDDTMHGSGTEISPLGVRLSADTGNLLQHRDTGLYYGIEAPPDVSNLYVDSLLGDDNNPGTREAPFRNFDKAASLITGNMNQTIRLKAGNDRPMYLMKRSLAVFAGTLTVTAYGDTYIDGEIYTQKMAERDADAPFYDSWMARDIERPRLRTSFSYTPSRGIKCVYSFRALNGGKILLRSLEMELSVPETPEEQDLHSVCSSWVYGDNNGEIHYDSCIVKDTGIEGDGNFLLTLVASSQGRGTPSLHWGNSILDVPATGPRKTIFSADRVYSLHTGSISAGLDVPVLGSNLKATIDTYGVGAVFHGAVYDINGALRIPALPWSYGQ